MIAICANALLLAACQPSAPAETLAPAIRSAEEQSEFFRRADQGELLAPAQESAAQSACEAVPARVPPILAYLRRRRAEAPAPRAPACKPFFEKGSPDPEKYAEIAQAFTADGEALRELEKRFEAAAAAEREQCRKEAETEAVERARQEELERRLAQEAAERRRHERVQMRVLDVFARNAVAVTCSSQWGRSVLGQRCGVRLFGLELDFLSRRAARDALAGEAEGRGMSIGIAPVALASWLLNETDNDLSVALEPYVHYEWGSLSAGDSTGYRAWSVGARAWAELYFVRLGVAAEYSESAERLAAGPSFGLLIGYGYNARADVEKASELLLGNYMNAVLVGALGVAANSVRVTLRAFGLEFSPVVTYFSNGDGPHVQANGMGVGLSPVTVGSWLFGKARNDPSIGYLEPFLSYEWGDLSTKATGDEQVRIGSFRSWRAGARAWLQINVFRLGIEASCGFGPDRVTSGPSVGAFAGLGLTR